MNLEKLKDTARKFEQKEDWRRAIEVYLKAIQQIESGQETSPDLSLYNRVGDLYLKTSDTASAVRSYERAVDLYADQGFFNNAIALCGKILRVNPGRSQTYLKLAQLHARKNVVIEAKRNLIEFLERMNALGQLDQAFQSVKEFADQFSGSQEIRLMLVDLLRAASREDEAREQLEKLAGEIEGRGERVEGRRSSEGMPAHDQEEAMGPRARPGSLAGLVFLDTGIEVPTETAPRLEEVEGIIEGPAEVEPEAVAPAEGLMLPDPLAVDPVAELEVAGLEPAGGMDLGDAELIQPGFDEDLGLERPDEATITFESETISGLEEPLPIPEDEMLLEAEEELIVSLAEVTPPAEPDAGMGLDLLEPEGMEEPPDGVSDLPMVAVGSEQVLAADVADLETRILDNPDDPELHAQLADALVSGGDEPRAAEELDLALEAYERAGDWAGAAAMADRLVILAPDVIRHHQKRVELAFRGGERGPLLDAYLALGDVLARAGADEKARAVYRRVQEHDPENAHAAAALAGLRAGAPPSRTPPPAGTPVEPPPPPAPTVTPGAASADFVDFSAMVLEESAPKDTRMRIDRRDPEGDDEQREFREILEQFKRGIEQNLDTEDYQAHYDLGVAFKEMGLLDEAIAEFQKALRAPEGRLRTSEALGICFYDKGQYAISETVLRRAAETVDGGDEAKIGLLYWLGRAAEAQGKIAEAQSAYERALAVDIRFMDLNERMHRLTAGRQR
jgi:tetratricopeptide (TPR) repeat protein